MMDENLPEESTGHPKHDDDMLDANASEISASSTEDDITQEVNLHSAESFDSDLPALLDTDSPPELDADPA